MADQELIEIARLHAEAAKIIADALEEMQPLRMSRENIEHNAKAIIARLAHANILMERYQEGQ